MEDSLHVLVSVYPRSSLPVPCVPERLSKTPNQPRVCLCSDNDPNQNPARAIQPPPRYRRATMVETRRGEEDANTKFADSPRVAESEPRDRQGSPSESCNSNLPFHSP